MKILSKSVNLKILLLVNTFHSVKEISSIIDKDPLCVRRCLRLLTSVGLVDKVQGRTIDGRAEALYISKIADVRVQCIPKEHSLGMYIVTDEEIYHKKNIFVSEKLLEGDVRQI